MKPIETNYAGCRFRSRLEARWAVFFDTLNIKWEYEFQGYDLPSGRYLPDFWLPQVSGRCAGMGIWFEVKPDRSEDDPRWAELAKATGNNVYVGFGLPRPPIDSGEEWIEEWSGPGWDNCMVFCDCDGGWFMRYGPESNYHNGTDYDHARVDRALTAARSARFEHGESPQPQPEPAVAALDNVYEWLKAYLTDCGGSAPVLVTVHVGKRAGYSERSIRRAAKTLGISSSKTGFNGSWIWAGPESLGKSTTWRGSE